MNSGIYKIRNKWNNKFYIGSSKDIEKRWAKHKATLRHNYHMNAHLQASWNMYGEKAFEFSIVELCSEEILLEREQYYIDSLKPQYNITLTAGRVDMTSETRKALSLSIKRAYEEGRLKKITKSVYQYDSNGNYLTEYNSVTEASIALGIRISCISAVCLGKKHTAGGFSWRYYKADKIEIIKKKSGRPRVRVQKEKRKVVVDDGELHIFNSPKEAAEYCKCTLNQIYKALTQNRLIFKKIKVNYG